MKASVRKAALLRRPATRRNNDRRVMGPHPRRRFLRLAAGTAVLPAVSRVAFAQAYPTRPITMIVPIAAGSSSDVVGRLLAERMGTALGQPIIIENVPGADGSIGVGRVARARPDGYTIEFGSLTANVLNAAFIPFPTTSLVISRPFHPWRPLRMFFMRRHPCRRRT